MNIIAGISLIGLIGLISFIAFLFFKRKEERFKKAGIYGIFDKKTEESIYIGCSGDIDKRVKEHKKREKHGSFSYKMFDPEKHYIKTLKHMPNSTKGDRLKEELNFIKKEKPKRNKRSYKS